MKSKEDCLRKYKNVKVSVRILVSPLIHVFMMRLESITVDTRKIRTSFRYCTSLQSINVPTLSHNEKEVY